MTKQKIKNSITAKDSNGYETFFLTESIRDSKYISIIEDALEKAKKQESKLPEWILSMDGMSGRTYRHFINNLIENIDNSRYLEIGCWSGSTCCSAIFENSVDAYCIDNWSEFGGPRNECIGNIKKCISGSEDMIGIELEENDFRKVEYSNIGKYNVYLFDGPHEEQDQYDGLCITQNALDDEFIFICDDWNWEQVRTGTLNAIKTLNLKIIYSLDIRTTDNNTHPSEDNVRQNSDWHNGYYISVLKKNKVAEIISDTHT
jgi:hypothetical protein